MGWVCIGCENPKTVVPGAIGRGGTCGLRLPWKADPTGVKPPWALGLGCSV
jgi:hypothetical protein